VEFALILPLLLLFLLGIIEVGRFMAIFSSVSSAARQASRYGAVGGDSGNGKGQLLPYYDDCVGMRRTAQNTSLLQPLSITNTEISIRFDRGFLTDTVGFCATNATSPTLNAGIANIVDGDRVVISITATYRPIVPIVPLPDIPMTFVAAHSIFTQITGPTPTPIPNPDLAISKVGFPGHILPGESTALTYTIQITNTGPVAASGIIFTDRLPTGMIPSSVTVVVPVTSTWVCPAHPTTSVFTCQLPFLGAFAGGNVAAPIVLYATAPLTPGIITNTAQVGYNQTDPIPANNTATASTFIATWVDLELHKTSLINPVEAGGLVTYALTVQNNNWVNETGTPPIILTDTLPLSTSYASFSGTGWSLYGVPNSTSVSFKFNLPLGPLPLGGTPTTLNVVLNAPNLTTGLPASGLITNTATVTSQDMPDPFPTNNTNITATTAVVADADLALSKTGPATANALINFNYILHVTNNNGPAPATNFTVTDTVPNQLPIVTPLQYGAGWGCNLPGGNLVVCTYSSVLNVNSTTSDITVTVRPSNGIFTVTNTAVVAFVGTLESDTKSANDSASVTTAVTTCFPGIVNASNSTVQPPSATASADSTTKAQITVTLHDACPTELVAAPYNAQQVTLTSSRGGQDTVTVDPITTSAGFVIFDVGSMTPGTSTYTAVAKDTVTNATVTIAQTAQVIFTDDCVTFTNLNIVSSSTLPISVANNIFGSSRRLTDLSLTWPQQNGRHVTSLVSSFTGAAAPIWSGQSNNMPFTIGSTAAYANELAWSGTAANRTLGVGSTQSLQLNFNYNVTPGTYTLNTTWDDTTGGHVCTKSYSVTL
jgi:uncharacterized repeat protein (TIGR01451 family)